MIDRRRLFELGLGAGASLAAPGLALARGAGHASRAHHHADARHGTGRGLILSRAGRLAAKAEPRRIGLKNLHTDEVLDAVYYDDGDYVPDALQAVDKVLRDYRTGEVHPIAPRLLDVLVELQKATGSKSMVQVISGYRSPQTNDMLREQSAEVARRSFHMDGKAIDLYLDDVALYHLHDAALDLSRGGVGYYPQSRFVHVDVGPVRHWQGA